MKIGISVAKFYNILYSLFVRSEFLEKDCSSAEIATCLGTLSYFRLKRAPLSSSPY